MPNVKATYYGFNPPFFGGPQGVLSRQVDERLIKNDLVQLLLTSPGERLYRPDFGTAIRSIVFESLNQNELNALSRSIILAIQKYEERVSVKDVSCIATEDGQTVNIKVVVNPNDQPLTQYVLELNATTDSVRFVR